MFLTIKNALLVPRPDSRKAERCIRGCLRWHRMPLRYRMVDVLLFCGWLGVLLATLRYVANIWQTYAIGLLGLAACWAFWRMIVLRRVVRPLSEHWTSWKIEKLVARGDILRLPQEMIDEWGHLREENGHPADSPSLLASIEVFYDCFALMRGGLERYRESTLDKQERRTLHRQLKQAMGLMLLYDEPTPELMNELERRSQEMA